MKSIGLQVDQTITDVVSGGNVVGYNTILDLVVSGGELSVGNVSEQNQYLLLVTRRGDWKENPLQGIGIDDIANDHNFGTWRRDIVEQFRNEGLSVTDLEISESKFNLKARYK